MYFEKDTLEKDTIESLLYLAYICNLIKIYKLQMIILKYLFLDL